MTNNFLIKIIKTFSRKEMTRFWEFAHSPYHNKHGEVRLLTEYLNKVYPDFGEKKTNRNVLFGKLFPGEKFDQKRLALLFTYTLRLLEKFLSVEQLKSEDFHEKLYLLRRLRSKELFAFYDKKLPETERILRKKQSDGQNTYESVFQLANEKDLYFNQLYRNEHQRNLTEKQRMFDLFYFSEKLKDACEMKLRSRILKMDFDLKMLKEVLEETENPENDFSKNAAIIVYSSIYKMLITPETSAYFETFTIIKQYEHRFPVSELQNIYNNLQNYCIRQINLGNQHFLKEVFKIYQFQLEKGWLLVDEFLPEWHYINIVTTGLRLEENDWVFKFIEEYKNLLKPPVVENAYSYNLASYYYNIKQFDKVLDLLIKVEYTDIRYNLTAKALLMRTYFDLDEEEAFLSLTDAFRQFLKRNRLISEFQKRGYYNLIKFARKVFQIKSSIGFDSKEKLREDLKKLMSETEKSEGIFNQSWLEGKIETLKSELAL